MLIEHTYIRDLGGEIPQEKLLDLAKRCGDPVPEPISGHFSEYFIASGLAPARVRVREENVLLGGHALEMSVYLKLFTYGVALWDYELELPADMALDEVARVFQIREVELPSRGSISFKTMFDQDQGRIAPIVDPYLEGKYEAPGFTDRLSIFIDDPGRSEEDALAILLPGEESYNLVMKRNIIQKIDLWEDQDRFLIMGNRAYLSSSLPPAEVLSFLRLSRVQLYELKIFDHLLDKTIEETYKLLDDVPLSRTTLPLSWLGRGTRAQVQHVLRMTTMRMELVDLIKDITNSTKVTADPYFELVYRRLLETFRVSEWFSSVKEKVTEIEGVQAMIMQRFDTSNAMFLELLIILLILVEVIMGLFRH